MVYNNILYYHVRFPRDLTGDFIDQGFSRTKPKKTGPVSQQVRENIISSCSKALRTPRKGLLATPRR